jgi:methionine synthase I (cobalamin-dependent)
MKRIALTTALALSLAAPAFASEQLAASLGVDAGDYTVAELIQLRTALENDDQIFANYIVNGGSEVVSTQSFGGSVASDFALRVLEEDDEHIRANFVRNGGAEVVSTQSFGGQTAAEIAYELVGKRDNENE